MAVKIYRFLRRAVISLFILPVRFYQVAISPLFPGTCRHTPTCSAYAIEALKVHGVFIGSFLAIWRFLRCQPWGTHGHDPVPPKGQWRPIRAMRDPKDSKK